MKQVINTENKPIKLWLNDIEESALNQAKNLANLPFTFRHISLMPDAHLGYGMPIGGILPTKKAIVPNAVGSDIGCGMCSVKTPLTTQDINIETLKKIMGRIRKDIPVGFKHHKRKQEGWLSINDQKQLSTWSIIEQEYENSLYQIGTLGGGNHFIEFQTDSEMNIWITIHSGSRNIGYKVAQYYNKLATELNEKWFSLVPKEWQLSFLPTDSYEGQCYFIEMEYCLNFSYLNRKHMMWNILNSIEDELLSNGFWSDFKDIHNLVYSNEMINIHHNYASIEHHYKNNVIVHRKGATQAKKNQLGIIPGSQGSSTYIVKGLGNSESFESCSHGAGRKMGRKQAQRDLDLEKEKERLDNLGIVHGIRTKKDLDEATGAYKDIDEIMENQKDLVEIVTELKPIAVIKG